MPDSHLYMKKPGVFLFISLLFAAILPLHIRFSSDLSVAVILMGILAYPVASIVWGFDDDTYSTLYSIIFSLVLGFTFAFQSQHPIGYHDTYRHLQFAIEAGPNMPLGDILSHIFGITYIIPHIISGIFNIQVTDAARIFPGIFFVGTVLAFHSLLSRRLIDHPRWQLTATILFASNWGVFRFMVEYRTLNIALATGILLLGILVNSDRIDNRLNLLGITFVTVLSLSHFATFVLVLLIALCYGLSRIGTRMAPSVFIILSTSILVFVAYLLLIGMFSTIPESLFYIFREFIATSEPANQADPVDDATALKYGLEVFVLGWIRRGIIGIACLAITFLTFKEQDRTYLFLLLSGGITGAFLTFSFVTGFALLPPRIMTFFAIPSSIITAMVLENISKGESLNTRRVLHVVAIALIIISVVIPMVKLPQYIVGETEPIRSTAPVDNDDSLRFTAQDFQQLKFTKEYLRTPVSDRRGRFVSYYYRYSESPYLWTYTEEHSCDVVYDSGNSVLHSTENSNCTVFDTQ